MSERKPRIIDPPKRIFLNYGDLEYAGVDVRHDNCEEVSWCTDAVHDTDVEYRLVKPARHRKRPITPGAGDGKKEG